MNIYKSLNEITLYIDGHLTSEIDYSILAKKLGVNVYTMERIFSLLSGYTLSDYIRKRKLSSAGLDLYNENSLILDIAVKYGYESATSFSRAFLKFHGVKPSKIKSLEDIVIFPRIIFDEDIKVKCNIDFKVETFDELKLYGVGIRTNNIDIKNDAPKFFKECEKKYGMIEYAIVLYEDEMREECTYYYVLYNDKKDGFKEFVIPSGKYLVCRIDSQNPHDIQDASDKFYSEFLPSCKYNLRETPEVEYYHDGVTDFYVPILEN